MKMDRVIDQFFLG